MKSRASGDNVTKEQESWLNNAYKFHIFLLKKARKIRIDR